MKKMKKHKCIIRNVLMFTLLLCLPAGVSGYAAETEQSQSSSAVHFERELDDYKPEKDRYNFYFTYKVVHPWWDAVALGIEEAQRQLLEKGVTVTYEYMAPEKTSAKDQVKRLLEAAKGDYDVIGVDVADEDIISPVLDKLVKDGRKVMTFSSSDAASGCRRIAYVGNTHNYEDGELLAESLCRKLHCGGKVAVIVGVEGAPCHEDRARGARDTIGKYPDMEIVDMVYDQDSIDIAYDLTKDLLGRYPDLDGIVCCNMSNSVGTARAVKESGRDIVIAGMDHDKEALEALRDGTIYCLAVQDCFSIGFDTIQVAVKIADGQLPGDMYPEKTEEDTTLIFQNDAAKMLEILYGIVE